MRILIDTNVILDFLLHRDPWFSSAYELIRRCADQKGLQGFVTSQSIADIFFILRKIYTPDERRALLLDLCQILSVVSPDHDQVVQALKNTAFSGFEDCLQETCAVFSGADYVITRNVDDFTGSRIPVLSPSQFLQQYIDL